MAVELSYGQVQKSAMNWPFFAASELNLFSREGLIVTASIFTSPPDPVNGLVSGSLDAINVIPDVALLRMLEGAPLCVIANTNIGSQYRLVVKPEITSFADLTGKRLGVNDGHSAEALILRKLLKQNSLSEGSYELVPSGPPHERCEKMKQGFLEGTMVTEPFHFLLEESGFRVLGSSLEVAPRYPFTVCVARRSQALNEKIVSFLKALRAACLWLEDASNREKAVEILSRSTASTHKQAQQTYELYFTRHSAPTLAPDPMGVGTVLELLAESGRIALPVPSPEQFIDSRYVHRLDERPQT